MSVCVGALDAITNIRIDFFDFERENKIKKKKKQK